jgi:hypothetical protein
MDGNEMRLKMKKITVAVMMLIGVCAYAGQVGLPEERLALPDVQGDHLVCIWDEAAGSWHTGFTSYNHNGSYSFQVPEWGRWYWIGLWDETNEEYVYGKWIGHFLTH